VATEATPRTVLIVDDDPDILEGLSLVLEDSGYRTLGASNGKAALGLLQATPAIDLILLDMMMPVMDGAEFRAAQLQLPVAARVPVVVFTGDGRVREKAAALDAAGYLKKPVELDELLKVVAEVATP
jgi:CheY-like chemotaxis protein